MADQYEAGTAWTISPLRTADAASLQAAYRPFDLPAPVAIARGGVTTNAGAITATNFWVLDTSIPASDYAWVVVQDNVLFQSSQVTGASIPDYVYWYPQGNNSLGTALTGPAMGPGTITTSALISSAGTYRYVSVPAAPAPRSTWVPLDPNNTGSGVATTLVAKADAAVAVAVGEWRANMQGCTMLGFPVNLWGTGELWAPMMARGS